MTFSNTRIMRILIIFGVLFCIIGCDQVTKEAARIWLSRATPLSFFKGIFKLMCVYNTGGFLSLGSQLPSSIRLTLFSVIVGFILVCALIFLVISKRTSHQITWALSLIVSGGIGNLIDRIMFHGSVTDFMIISFGPLHTGVFNVADAAVVVGAGLLLFDRFRRPTHPFNQTQRRL